jgi:hypothetical protein
MRTRVIGRAKSGGMLAVLALCYALALQAMLAPPAALAAMARNAAAAGHALCDTPGVPHAPGGDGQNACCLPGCAAACTPRTAFKEPPPSILPPVPGLHDAALRTALLLPTRLPASTGEPSVAAMPPQANPRAPPAA